MKVYVVTMYRWGNKEDHSYIIGVFSDWDKAFKYGVLEEQWRGGKYDFDIESKEINEFYREIGEDEYV